MTQSDLSVADQLVVSMDYTLKLKDGEVLDRSEPNSPLAFVQGAGNIIPGLETALYGMRIGDAKAVEVSPEEGYGAFDPEALEELPRTAFPPDMPLELGLSLTFRDQGTNELIEGVVAEIEDSHIVVDFNHPLAGETLYFDVKIAGLRSATSEELAHGHVHLN